MAKLIHTLSQNEQLNFLLTNRIPRRLATQFMGWLSGIQSPHLTRLLIRIWRAFADDLDLSESPQREYGSLQECFTRSLLPGARTIDPRADSVVSPCDAIVGAHGDIVGTRVFQAKGFPYYLEDLIPDKDVRESFRDGKYITLRLKSSMYHRFHAPLDCHVQQVTYIAGDTWNVNPIALQRIEKLYCKNERAVINLDTGRAGSGVCLVAVAAILVASIRLRWLENLLDMHYKGPQKIPCDAAFSKGDELGYFQHGSTIILFATSDFNFCDDIRIGERVQMGRALLSYPKPQPPNEVTP
ncbi:Phosphatidylserine decarboxylase proenzyme [Halioglobus japonicus]|nr:Phosphatidylserine decarboxylase proenzyme [Halioglobus japonicus]